jgi:hypothetical protein
MHGVWSRAMSPRPAGSLAAALLVLAACGGGDDGDDDNPAHDGDVTAVDAEPSDGVPPVDAPPAADCPDPDNCAWLDDYLHEVLGKLTGQRPVSASVTITRRATSPQRDVARQYLMDELTARGLAPVLHDYGSGKNIVVTLPATTGATTPRIVIGAHFDGVSAGPAAADNGTGTAIVVAAARYLAARPVRSLPIDLVLFDQEEAGLIGSTAYALKLRSENVITDSVHNVDMVSFDGDGDHAIELWSPTSELEAYYRSHAEARGMPVSAVTFASSDHQPFVDRGFPTVGVCEEFVGNDHTPNYHRVTDTYENVDFAYMLRVTRLLLVIFEDRAVAD